MTKGNIQRRKKKFHFNEKKKNQYEIISIIIELYIDITCVILLLISIMLRFYSFFLNEQCKPIQKKSCFIVLQIDLEFQMFEIKQLWIDAYLTNQHEICITNFELINVLECEHLTKL